MSTFGFLILQDLRKFKNYILEIKKKPWKLLLYIFYILWFGFILYTAFNGNGDKQATSIPNLVFKKDLFSVLIKALVFVLFTTTLYSSSKNFDGLFSMGDVNFLFPSPISPKIVLAYSMVKQSFVLVITSIFMVFMFPLLQVFYGPLHPGSMVYGIVGIMALFLFTVPFSYLTFVLSTRFGFKKWLHYFLYGLVIFILMAIGYGIYIQQDLLQGVFWAFNHPLFNYIPIIGWSAELIGVSILGKTALSTLFLVLQLLTIGILTFLAIFLGEDYYEDALPSAEKRWELLRNKNQGKRMSMKDAPSKKVRQVEVKSVGQGPWAFLWMQLVSNKRASGSLIFQWKVLAVLIVSIAFGVLMPDKSSMIYFIASGAIAYITFLSSMQVSIDYELKMKYIFILPGQAWKKILALNIVPIMKVIIFMSCALLPVGVIFRVSLFSIVGALAFPMSMVFLNLFSSVIIHILIPSSFDMKAFFPVIRLLTFLLFLLPPGIIGIIVGAYTNSVALAFISVAGINLLLSALFLWMSELMFGRLELR
ncbi:putative ABC exporter domain-containing protein [Irregularibacter muris]|uniref:ABC exporter domain-containing protein n=1 Tax=Irregularibacter muris TaxID=1796619 RepID=A0AAE3HK08_9FIRM|nr:putative ABC exporter domain-containing protein [Irregularibacter muris]MCR1900199.1 putative ABC exporter domain-containing protein [Irregularibacter muris]